MSLPKDDAATLSARWTEGVLLKRDVFSTVERGRFRSDTGEVDAVLRRLDQVPWWSFIPARHLFGRERRALALARHLHVGPELLWAGRQALVRGFINGVALHLARPTGDVAYFRSAKQALRKLHRAGICHNDLAKEQNWLRGSDGRAYVTDFQLAACFRTRSRLFRIAAYEDLRHLLKHKRSYAPEALTPKERKILARKSFVASIWLMTGKKVYRAVTRGLFNFTDREGGGRRLVNDAPLLINLIRKNPDVRDAAIVAFADRRTGVGLYAFVEAGQPALEAQLRDELAAAKHPKPPEHIQVVQALPRDAAGNIRTEVLQLVAMNQLDLIEPMMTSDTDHAFLKGILEQRKNLRDRFNFEAADLSQPRPQLSSPGSTGRPSIPETPKMEPRSRGATRLHGYDD
jgi:serine/threonine protein kinase